MDDDEPSPDVPIELAIDGVLDLHTFHPRDLRTLIPDYLEECHKRAIYEVRIIHGKGTGALRAAVREALNGHPLVRKFESAQQNDGGEGVTIAVLAG